MNSSITVEDFESIALPYLNDLFRTARRICGSATEAEDLVQETFLQAWKSFHRFQMGTNCRAWLFKILFHVTSHHRRKSYRLKQTSEHEEEMLENLTAEPSIPQHLRDEEVLSAFAKLPRPYAEVVLLADVQEFSYKEVAEISGIPIGTVMSRLSRGRRLLRTELAGVAANYGIQPAAKPGYDCLAME